MISTIKYSSIVLLLLAIAHVSLALKLDIEAHAGHESKSKERCIRNFVARDQLVVVTAIVDGHRGDGQQLNMHIRDAVGNDYGRPKDVVGENKYAFTSHADSAFDNFRAKEAGSEMKLTMDARTAHNGQLSRHVELDVDIGADAKDWSAIQADEKLKPTEGELRRIEEVVGEIVYEMDYLRSREMKLRDTNESTNERVKMFAIATMIVLMALGAWQVIYLRAYFRSKHLI